MTMFTDKTSKKIEDALDNFKRAKRDLERYCTETELGIKICLDNKLFRLVAFPFEIFLRVTLRQSLEAKATIEPIPQLLHKIWVTIREENELRGDFKKLVHQDATALAKILNDNKMHRICKDYVNESKNFFLDLIGEVERIKHDTST